MEKFCAQCGTALVPGAKFCPSCGRPIAQQAAPQPNGGYHYAANNMPYNSQPQQNYNAAPRQNYNPAPQQNYYGAPVMNKPTKKEFRKICTNEKYRKDLKTSAIVMYVLVGLNALLCLAGNTAGLLDVAIYLALALGMHLGKSKACAYGVLGYAIFSVIVILATTGNFGGWLWLVAAYSGIKAFGIADKEYEATYGA